MFKKLENFLLKIVCSYVVRCFLCKYILMIKKCIKKDKKLHYIEAQ